MRHSPLNVISFSAMALAVAGFLLAGLGDIVPGLVSVPAWGLVQNCRLFACNGLLVALGFSLARAADTYPGVQLVRHRCQQGLLLLAGSLAVSYLCAQALTGARLNAPLGPWWTAGWLLALDLLLALLLAGLRTAPLRQRAGLLALLLLLTTLLVLEHSPALHVGAGTYRALLAVPMAIAGAVGYRFSRREATPPDLYALALAALLSVKLSVLLAPAVQLSAWGVGTFNLMWVACALVLARESPSRSLAGQRRFHAWFALHTPVGLAVLVLGQRALPLGLALVLAALVPALLGHTLAQVGAKAK